MHLHAYASPNFARVLFTFAHLMIPFGIYYVSQLSWSLWIKLIIACYIYDSLGGFGITCGAHRLWAHRSYTANYFFRFILMLLNCIAFQGELFYWARDHRVHHKYSDTAADPHDINRGFWFAHIGWLYFQRTPENEEALKKVPVQDLLDDPVIQFQLDYYAILVIILRFLLPIYIGYTITGSWKVGLFFNGFTMWCISLNFTFLVNSAAHTWGYRPYDPKIEPAENKAVIFLALGEGHHNFHHSFPQDYATGEYEWNESFNPSKLLIDLAAKLGLVTSRKRSLYDSKKKRFSTLTI